MPEVREKGKDSERKNCDAAWGKILNVKSWRSGTARA